MSPTRRAGWAAIASAIVHEIHTIIFIIYIAVHGKNHPDPHNYPGGFWDPDYLKAVWVWRQGAANMEIAMAFFDAVSLFLFLFAANVLREMYREEKGNARHIMFNCFLIGGLLRLFEFLQMIGLNLGEQFMASFPNLPYDVWVALTVFHDLSRALGAFVFEGDMVTIIIGVGILSYFSIRGMSSENHRLSKRHGIFGCVLLFFLLLIFILDLATITGPTSARGDWLALGIFGGIVGLLLFPAWLVWLGMQLRNLEIPGDSDLLQTQKLVGNNNL